MITSLIVGLAIHLMVIIIPLLNDITALNVLNNSGMPVFSALLSFIFLGERPTRLNILAIWQYAALRCRWLYSEDNI